MLTKGTKFGKLTVLKQIPRPKEKKYGIWYECQCSCEKKKIIITTEYSLVNNKCTSCGCYRSEKARAQIKVNREIMKQNGSSTRNKKTIYYNLCGEEKTCSQWAKEFGISRQALWNKLKKYTIDEIAKQYYYKEKENGV